MTGGGNSPEALAAYAEEIAIDFANEPDIPKVMRWGMMNVKTYGKITYTTICEFFREYRIAHPPKYVVPPGIEPPPLFSLPPSNGHE